MRRRHLLILLLCCGCASCGFQPSATVPEFNPQELVGAWVDMWNSYDLSMVDSLFVTDSTATYFSSEREGLIRGIEAIREHHAGFGFIEGGKIQGNRLWVEDMQADLFGSSAIVTGIWYFQREGEGPEDIQRGPMTFVYVLRDGQYRLAHLNFSEYDLNPDT